MDAADQLKATLSATLKEIVKTSQRSEREKKQRRDLEIVEALRGLR